MSLMWKLLATTLLLSSFAQASVISEKVEDFLDDEFGSNPRITDLNVEVIDEKPLSQLKGWNSYVVLVEARLKQNPKELIKQRMIWFSNGTVITKELIGLSDAKPYSNFVKPDFQKEYYKKENLVFGNPNAKHKVAIFSDPLCPFCKDFAPEALRYMKRYPNDFAVYYYHFPLVRIHPASAVIVRAAVAAERKGVKNVSIKMYDIKIGAREKDVKKILRAFNDAVGTNITQKDIDTAGVKEQIKKDKEIATYLFVGGTPTIYVDGKLDKTRKKYKTVK